MSGPGTRFSGPFAAKSNVELDLATVLNPKTLAELSLEKLDTLLKVDGYSQSPYFVWAAPGKIAEFIERPTKDVRVAIKYGGCEAFTRIVLTVANGLFESAKIQCEPNSRERYAGPFQRVSVFVERTLMAAKIPNLPPSGGAVFASQGVTLIKRSNCVSTPTCRWLNKKEIAKTLN